jgi:phage head maturation protease
LVRVALPCEIRVVDEAAREIEVCATSEAVDAHGTIFGYEASKDAFERWVGNVREMHERKAVGRKVAVRYDDAGKKVYVRLRISKGAEDTWEKVSDGTLNGASIGASNVAWRRQRVSGGDVPYATHYDLVELSLVDSPSNPDASGVAFVRVIGDGVPDDALLSELPVADDHLTAAPAAAPAAASAAPSQTVIREGAGALTTDDPAAAIAQAALSRGQAQVVAQLRVENGAFSCEADDAAGQNGSGMTPNELRLAALGAPTYVERAREGVKKAAEMRHPGAAQAQTRAADVAPGASFDVDGDHDGSGDPSGAGLEHADELHAHAAHDHPHSGVYDDQHVHNGPHLHLDGTSHTHDHAHDHGHHDHSAMSERAQAGHSHDHVHTHDHGHFYRVADGALLDERLVTGEQLRTREYVSDLAFRTAGGVAGSGLTAAQYRVAAGIEMRLELAAGEMAMGRADGRAQGAFSRNPLGAADIGTPAAAAETSTDAAIAASATGQVNELDRDGQPTTCDDESSTGTLDVSDAPEGYLELTEQRADQQRADQQRALVAEITAAMSAESSRVASALGDIQQRLARIEAQPQPGGPALRVADRTSALSAAGGGGSSVDDRIAALQGLAGRIRDPQAQVAVAAEMIRLKQEGGGMPAAMQVMPRAGRGWGE